MYTMNVVLGSTYRYLCVGSYGNGREWHFNTPSPVRETYNLLNSNIFRKMINNFLKYNRNVYFDDAMADGV